MKKLKNIAFSIMSAGGLIVPISLMASCGATTETDTSLSITPKATVESLWIEDVTGNNLSSAITLSKVFDGITSENLDNITATLNDGTPGIGTTHTITLTAKDGFVFGDGAKTIQSEEFTTILPTLSISKISPITADIYQTEINGEISLDTLKKAFNIANDIEFDNITTSVMDGATPDTKKIVLTANEGFVFGDGAKTIQSEEFTPTLSISKISSITADIYQTEINGEISLDTLKKAFNIANDIEFDNITTSVMDGATPDTKKIVLTANAGHVFEGGGNTLESDEFTTTTVLDISLPAPSNVVILIEEIANPNALELSTLQKLFDGIDGTNYPTLITATLSTFPENGTNRITLTAAPGYNFTNGENTFDSFHFTPTKTLGISLVETPEPITSSEIVNFNPLVNPLELSTLQKLFNGIDNTNYPTRVAATPKNNLDGTYSIILNSSSSFIFENGTNTLESVVFTPTELLNISLVEIPEPITSSEIANPNALELSTLQKLFNGIDSTNYPALVKAALNTFPNGTYRITLTAAPEYNFTNGTNNLESIGFSTVTFLDISLLETPEPITSSEIANPKALELSTLQKLFSGIDEVNLRNVTVTLIPNSSDGTYRVALVTFPGYLFADGSKNNTLKVNPPNNTLVSNPFTPI